MKNIINIGIPSKGRLRNDVLKIFIKKKLKIISERGERDLIGSVKNKSNNKIKNVINGGRYDQLISDLGSKKQVSAVGAALNLNYWLWKI